MSNTRDNPITQAARGLAGEVNERGRYKCPICNKWALTINDGERRPFVLYCFGIKTEEHQQDVYKHFKARLPVHSVDLSYSPDAKQERAPEERRAYTLKIWNRLGHETVDYNDAVVGTYLAARGIAKLPFDAATIMPPDYFIDKPLPYSARNMGWVQPFRNVKGKFQGLQITHLDGDATGKRDEAQGAPRTSLGNLKGNFIALSKIGYDKELDVLVIGEGAETTLSVMQATGYPGVAAGGKWNYDHIVPPRAKRYIALADNGAEKDAQDLADHLLTIYPGCTVQIALPEAPAGAKKGYDWNDYLLDVCGPGAVLWENSAVIAEAIEGSPEAKLSKKGQRNTRLDALSKLHPGADYDEEREKIAADFDLRKSTVDEEVEKRRRQARKQAGPPPKPDIKKLFASAQDIIESDDVLALAWEDASYLITGRRRTSSFYY
jgi:hypothetical protein